MEFIIALIILCFLGKHILLNIKVNSVLFMIFGVIAFTLKTPLVPVEPITIILLLINIIDCIHDFAICDKYYDDLSDNIDKSYAIKSLTVVVLLALGWFIWDRNFIYAFLPRAIFFCIIYPLQILSVNSDIQDKIDIGYPLPYNKWQYSCSKKTCYHYEKIIKKLFQDGKLVTNVEIVEEEFDASNQKLAENYPKKFIDKLARLFNKQEKDKLKDIKSHLDKNIVRRHKAYISSEFFEQYSSKIEKVLKSKKGTFSPWSIKKFIELEELNLTAPNGFVENVEWSEYFIIKSLKELVKKGKINDYDISDNPLKNHAYGVEIASKSASDNPLLALDDDE